MKYLVSTVVLLILLLSNCKKDKIGPQFEVDSPLAGYKILILNEGNFGSSNASITTYNPFTKETANNSFIEANGTQIGDVIQSSTAHNGDYYICINNSSKIVVVDSISLALKHELTGFNSPRYIKFYNNKAYVSDLYQGGIYVVDLLSKQISGFINTEGGTGEMVINQNHLYVIDGGDVLNNQGNNKLYKIDLIQDAIIDSLILPSKQPNSLVMDNNDKLWVMLGGGIGDSIPSIARINSTSFEVEQNFKFTSVSESPSSLRINGIGDRLYYVNEGIFEMAVNASTIPTSPLISKGGKNIYGLNINPTNGELYITDAKSFNEIGTVYRYFPNGNEIDRFNAGIIPQYMQF